MVSNQKKLQDKLALYIKKNPTTPVKFQLRKLRAAIQFLLGLRLHTEFFTYLWLPVQLLQCPIIPIMKQMKQ